MNVGACRYLLLINDIVLYDNMNVLVPFYINNVVSPVVNETHGLTPPLQQARSDEQSHRGCLRSMNVLDASTTAVELFVSLLTVRLSKTAVVSRPRYYVSCFYIIAAAAAAANVSGDQCRG